MLLLYDGMKKPAKGSRHGYFFHVNFQSLLFAIKYLTVKSTLTFAFQVIFKSSLLGEMELCSTSCKGVLVVYSAEFLLLSPEVAQGGS